MRRFWMAGSAVATALVSLACAGPSAPTAALPPAAPVATIGDPPVVTCPGSLSLTAPFIGPAVVNYSEPAVTSGEGLVTVACTPATDANFPIGTTNVDCIATDALRRTASCSFVVTVAAPPRLLRTRILAFGDSITAGDVLVPNTDDLILEPAPATAYPAVLSQLLRERYGPQPSVFNGGRSGEKAAFGDRRLPFEIGKANADAVVLLEGANDLLYADPPAAIQAAELGVSAMAAEARHLGVRVFIALLTPTRPGRRQIPLATIQAGNERLRVVARGEGAAIIDTFNALMPALNDNISSDGLHPTPAGYRRIAETVFAALRADLEVR